MRAAKQLIDDGRLPNVHCLFVGEGPDMEILTALIDELGFNTPPCTEPGHTRDLEVQGRASALPGPIVGPRAPRSFGCRENERTVWRAGPS